MTLVAEEHALQHRACRDHAGGRAGREAEEVELRAVDGRMLRERIGDSPPDVFM